MAHVIFQPKNISEMNKEAQKRRLQKMSQKRAYYCKNVDKYPVHFSGGNRKLGDVHSVSLIPVLDCANCKECRGKCYDLRNDCIYNGVVMARSINSAIWKMQPDRYFSEIEGHIKKLDLDYFRFHIGGDIKDSYYFLKMVDLANACPVCEILAFTKCYTIVNTYVKCNGPIPENLQIIFSEWPGVNMENPYNFPTSSPIFVGEYAKEGDYICPGDCTQCATAGEGCWTLNDGERVVFFAH